MKQSGIGRSATAVAVLGGAAMALPAAAVEIRADDDYVAVVIEAEEFDELDERWVVTAPDTPAQADDPDGNHSDRAVGSTYLELLPDYRVTHSSPPGPVPSYWGTPGSGPSASYIVDFPEPGRYHVHARAFTTGTEDNGIHFGLDGVWPESGARWQICSSADNDWRWSSKQRDSGGNVCGVRKTVWLTVETAGLHSVDISAREDGFELDRMMLIKDRSNNTRSCEPVSTEADRIVCWDGGISQPDDFVDLELTLQSARDTGAVGERFELVATARNLDTHDDADEVELAVRFDTTILDVVATDTRCETIDSGVLCRLDEALLPYAPPETITLTLEARADGTPAVEATLTARQSDEGPDNHDVRLDLLVDAPPPPPTRLEARLGELPDELVAGEPATLSFGLDNTGGALALDSSIVLSLPEGIVVDGALPEECRTEASRIICTVGTLEAAHSRDYVVTLRAGQSGTFMLTSSASAANAGESAAGASIGVVADADTKDGTDNAGGDDETHSSGGESDTTSGSDDTPSPESVAGASGGGSGAGGPLAVLALLGTIVARRARRLA